MEASEDKVDISTPVPELPTLPQQEIEGVEKLSNLRLALIGSATACTWFSGVMLVCGSGFLLPVIQTEFHSSAGDVQWVTAAFNITWGCCALVSGRLGDIYGLRKAYLAGMSFYVLWIFLSSFMPNLIGLSFTRAFAGIGYAIASPAASGTIGTCFPQGRPKTIAFSVMAGSGAVGAGLGWLLGGLFVTASPYTWRSLSLLVSGISVYPLVISYFFFPLSKPHPTDKKVDWLGASLITVSQVLLGLGLTFPVTNPKGWRAPYVPVCLVLAGIIFLGFLWRQRFLNRLEGNHDYPPPLTPLRLFKNTRQLIVIYVGTFFVWIGTDALAVMGAYFYEDVLLLSGWQSGLRVAPNTFSGLFAAISVGLLLHKVPAKALLIVVDLVGGSSGILFAARPMARAYWKSDLWAWLTTGTAADGTNAISSTLISDYTAPGDQAVANGMWVTIMRFGATLGLALSTITRSSVQSAKEESLRRELGLAVGETLEWVQEQKALWVGVKAALFFCGGSIYVAALVVAIGMKGWDVLGKSKKVEESSFEKPDLSSSPSLSLTTCV
ncbi:hypothetical protein TREMEDRAFT_65617 [Tremella mesenterica DSM 1558]|uniref:uncharacterized protein n=1 Tax=Tremella mesenterica (strain ATCC 24925 / CBS 8224 / DSM 1558 / NBRC 9311 / NRRL Y-6157 / RJB 2259-6 / UBC 559-6) TaxID=578456 RepID=UPI00032C4A46|nr:uncharacterized protein TREMEDRAFT_65617 [Tremella mesenterica DSM 1558]EIW66343.1 hypothetical protein TREMEDRAFT_65617 [Tremella mesenterica DSM 1558]